MLDKFWHRNFFQANVSYWLLDSSQFQVKNRRLVCILHSEALWTLPDEVILCSLVKTSNLTVTKSNIESGCNFLVRIVFKIDQ
jgi:hypothetical protein